VRPNPSLERDPPRLGTLPGKAATAILALPGKAPILSGPLSSNVRPHQTRRLRTTRQNSPERNPQAWKGASFSLTGCSRRSGSILDFPVSDWWP
jgi:hypothetical protein